MALERWFSRHGIRNRLLLNYGPDLFLVVEVSDSQLLSQIKLSFTRNISSEFCGHRMKLGRSVCIWPFSILLDRRPLLFSRFPPVLIESTLQAGETWNLALLPFQVELTGYTSATWTCKSATAKHLLFLLISSLSFGPSTTPTFSFSFSKIRSSSSLTWNQSLYHNRPKVVLVCASDSGTSRRIFSTTVPEQYFAWAEIVFNPSLSSSIFLSASGRADLVGFSNWTTFIGGRPSLFGFSGSGYPSSPCLTGKSYITAAA